MSKPIIIVEYSPAWPHLFVEERKNIEQLHKEGILRIEHVGSTSVPGLSAKPTIDIMAGLANLDALDELVEPLKGIGYQYWGEHEPEASGWHYFDKGSTPKRFHLHVVCIDSEFWKSHLVFRDYLRRHPDVAAEYQVLKMRLAREYGSDRMGYNAAKTDFIKLAEQRGRFELSESASAL